MGLKKLLEQNKSAIVNQWFERVVKTYAPDTAQFLKNQKDSFSNPIGSALSRGLPVIFDQLLAGPEMETVKTFLDPIIRIRAVQNYSPSQATAFILILKNIIRDILKDELNDSRITNELLEFELQIDALSLASFDMYMACKEKIYDLKNNLEKNKIHRAFERAGLIAETPERDPGLQSN